MSIRMACCIGLAIVGTTVVPATMAATTKSIDVQLYSPMLLADFSKSLGLSEKDGLEKGLSLPTAHGTESVRLQQVYDKAPVFGHGLVIEIDKQGRVLKASGNLALGLNDDLSGRLPTLSADAAWQALPHKDSDPKARDYQAMVVRAQTGPAAVDKADALDLDDSRLLVPAKLGILPGLLESKWVYRVVFDYPQQRRMFRALIDARDGSVVRVNDDTLHDGIGAAKQKVVSSRSEVKPATVEVDEFTIPVQIQGPGGNLKTGPYTYGGDRPALVGLSDVTGTRCTLRNPRVATRVYSETIAEGVPWVFPCTVSDGDAVNGAYSPNNDAHNFVEDTLQMYLAYMRVPAFTQQIVVLSHSTRNGLWVPPNIVQLGDGDEKDFPSAVLDVVGHELGHGIFIDNNVDAVNAFDGIYDTFPDMVGTAAKWYRRGHEDFLIGLEMRKGDGEFHRNMCKADVPPNPANGVYNQVFCKLSKVLGTAIAFQIFGRANLLYWNDPLDYGTTSYCGLERAARDIGAPLDRVTQVFDEFGRSCIDGVKLSNGQEQIGTIVFPEGKRKFYVDVPVGAKTLEISGSGPPVGTFLADLLVRYGHAPTDTEYDCRDVAGLAKCLFPAPKPGRYYVEKRIPAGQVLMSGDALATWVEASVQQ